MKRVQVTFALRASIINGWQPARSYLAEREIKREESGRVGRRWLERAKCPVLLLLLAESVAGQLISAGPATTCVASPVACSPLPAAL